MISRYIRHTQISNTAQPKIQQWKQSTNGTKGIGISKVPLALPCTTSSTQAQSTAWSNHMEVRNWLPFSFSACSHISCTESDYSGRPKRKFIHNLFCMTTRTPKKRLHRNIYNRKFYKLKTGNCTTVLWINKYFYSNQFC